MRAIPAFAFLSAVILFFVFVSLSWGPIYSLFPEPGLGAQLVTTIGAIVLSCMGAYFSFFALMAAQLLLVLIFGFASPYIFKMLWAAEYAVLGIRNEDDYVSIMDLDRSTNIYYLERIFPDVHKALDIPFATRRANKLVKLGWRKPTPLWLHVRKSDADAYKKALNAVKQERLTNS